MIRQPFNSGWTISSLTGFAALFDKTKAPRPVTLPHDAMIEKKRDAAATTGDANGFFPGGAQTYTKKYYLPPEMAGQTILLEFEGAYMNAAVYINGDLAGRCPHGYTTFHVDAGRHLIPGRENEIKVVTKTSNDRDSRWYSGSGLYRDVWIITGGPLHIAADGVRVSTPDVERDQAVVEAAVTIANRDLGTRKVFILSEIRDGAGKVVNSEKSPLTAFHGESVVVRQRFFIQNPDLWSPDSPDLYTCEVTVIEDENVIDQQTVHFGIRKLQLDPKHGLRINGETIKMRGGCIHHDNGVLGACAFAGAEERRVQILKEAGYNAIRSAHNPISKAMLDACDRLGMLVMDELNDAWCENKSDYDSALFFADWWEFMVEAMVAKDFNHPSVIFYSIGNEIQEVVRPGGAALNRQIVEKVRKLDNSRYVTNGVNVLLSMNDRNDEIIATLAAKDPEVAALVGRIKEARETMKDLDVNTMMSLFGIIMERGAALEIVDEAINETASALDVFGYNYLEGRYEIDGEKHPNRVVVGAETYVGMIDRNWRLVKDNGHVIGDFCWTAWDYLGEAGIGKVDYGSEKKGGHFADYPWYIAYCGAIDILGNRRPASYYQEIVWGLRKDPYIAVQRPEHHGKKFSSTPWSWSDTISSWTWSGYEGKPIQVEVYADADEVELLLNGQSIGRQPAGESNRFKAVFELTYQPGELTALARKDGRECGRSVIRTAGQNLRLTVACDRQELRATGNDLAYLMITLTDEQGTIQSDKDRKIAVDVEGAGCLQGFGSADPTSTENFFDSERTTFDGAVLAVVRSADKPGQLVARVRTEGCEEQVIRIPVN